MLLSLLLEGSNLSRCGKQVWIFSISLMLCVLGEPVYADISSYAEAINKAGKQKKLTQCITKLYDLKEFAASNGIVVSLSLDDQLEEAIDLFKMQLQELQEFNQSPEVDSELNRLEAVWAHFQQFARLPVGES